MNAELITIGDEILIGQIVDTNSAWIAQKLNMIGVKVQKIISTSDDEQSILNVINDSLSSSEIVIITGGLGPTNDDVTKRALLSYYGGNLVVDESTLKQIESFFKKRGLPLTELNRKQAEVPDSCLVLPNMKGTAPGMWFERDSKILISLPGVPFEMESLMEESVLPKLKLLSSNIIIHQTIQTFGLPESFLAEKLFDWENSIPKNIKLAYLPSPNSIRLRISAYGNSEKNLNDQITILVKSLQNIIPKYIFGYGEVSMQEVVGLMLKKISATISIAESCTGGNISHLITLVPGSSSYFRGGLVAYSNNIKIDYLKVDKELIAEFGAVSRRVVEQMAKGIKDLLKTDYAIAISGIAGPDGGTENKPIGTVWISVISNKNLITKEFRFGNDRQINITRSSVTALNMLRLLLLEEHPYLAENIFS